MTKEEFIKVISVQLKKHGFYKKSNHFYLNCENSFVCVIGLDKSNYGPYYYIEYGFAVSTINPKMPWPKFSELNINCGRWMVNGRKDFVYETISAEQLKDCIEAYVVPFAAAGHIGVEAINKEYIPHCCYLIGQETLNFLGIDADAVTVYSEKLWE